MDFLSIYTCAGFGAIILLYLIGVTVDVFQSLYPVLRRRAMRYLRYRVIIRRHRFVGPLSFAHMMCALTATGIVAASNTIGISDSKSASSRAAQLCVIFAVPLFTATHSAITASMFKSNLRLVSIVHAGLGYACLLEAVLHASIGNPKLSLHTHNGLFGFIVSAAPGSVCA